ncbi:2Fe-2S iron-sulfur cluster binding domain-containing protein [Xanthomonas sontii]|uniref:2Fe-2S iron-sulfur cluster binding domain-containing protein n=2 Tax=Xanthomonas TaxID=338 RepID=A0A6N7Q7J6_9XANT|nr:ferredoxin reductase [Xanthomonas sontii]MRG99246.1 2Fe-2S iron-sulfur cluster binding domain-containing protein [Xanthomonas sontii]MRH73578.1 2Fe-2S iron-sulfur cluster binding domain-containing protein [Xanthomonas sontii]
MNAARRPAKLRPAARALRAWVKPDVFDFWSTRLHPLWTWQRPRARLVQREAASSDAVTLVLQPNRHWRGLRAGQHVELGVEIDGRRLLRSYSPTPLPGGRLAITVKTVDGGRVSQYLAGAARIGEVFELGQAYGEMVLPTAPHGRWLLLAAGSGITPMRALLRQLADAGMPADVDLLYWARRHDQVCFRDELQALAAAHPRFRLHLVITGEGETPAPRVDTLPLEALGDLGQAQVLACGPGGFVQSARARLQHRVARFQAEAFSPPPALADVEQGTVAVTLARSGRVLQLPRGQSLLTALEAEGLRPKHGCRMGICNSCACGKQAGITRDLLSGAHAAEPGSLKLCVNSASSDLTLDL